LHILKKYIFNITNNYTTYLIKQKINELYNYNNSLELYDNLSMKKNQPPKRQMKINKEERKNIIRKSKKSQTKKEKIQINRNKSKKKLTYFQNYNIKNSILNNNNYQINISNENILKKNKISLNSNDIINIISENNYK
jgi:Zn-dependent metalloprotease